MGTCILKAGSQGTTSFPLSNPFPVGFASFWSNGPTPESCDLRWPHLTNTSVLPCIHPHLPRVPVRSWENCWGKKNNNGESSSGPSATAAPRSGNSTSDRSWVGMGWLRWLATSMNRWFFLNFFYTSTISAPLRGLAHGFADLPGRMEVVTLQNQTAIFARGLLVSFS